MKNHIQAAINHHTAQAERLHQEKLTSIERLKTSGIFDGDQLLAYGNAIKKMENEMREHSTAIATLSHLLKQVEA